MAPLAPSKLSATGFTYFTTPTRVCVGGLSGVDVAQCKESMDMCVNECRCETESQTTDGQKQRGGPTVSDELCVFCVMACRQQMGELEVLRSHSHLLVRLA